MEKMKLDRNGYAPTIMTEYDNKCFFTGRTNGLVRHEVFFGSANRKLSKEWGCWVYLTPEMHNMSNYGVHFNKENDLILKRAVQKRFEELYGHEKFMQVFGKNYL